jgi:hypothetical protein
MTPLLENLIVSLLTGVMSSASMLQVVPTGNTRDWVAIAATGVLAFGGSFINGIRQLHKVP